MATGGVDRGLPPRFWTRPWKRLLPGLDGRSPRLLANAASYNDARENLPLGVLGLEEVREQFDVTHEPVTALLEFVTHSLDKTPVYAP
jgi:hypothetical protein